MRLQSQLHHPEEVGYIQGMSYLSAVLLMHTDASSGGSSDPFPAFICLANLLEQPQRVLKTLLRLDGGTTEILLSFWNAQFSLALPRLSAHFQELGVLPQMYLIEWIFTLFAKSLPLDPVAWIWDQVLVLGDQCIFQAALGLLSLLEESFFTMNELGDVAAVLKDLSASPRVTYTRNLPVASFFDRLLAITGCSQRR